MATYAAALAASEKRPVYVLDFTGLGQRFKSSRTYTDTTSAADVGLTILDFLEIELDLGSGQIAFDEITVRLTDDSAGTVGTFLGSNDSSIRGASVTLKYGFDTVLESSFQSIALLVKDWTRVSEGYEVLLASALTYLDRPLFEEFEDDGFTLYSTLMPTHEKAIIKGDTTEAGWRDSGFLLLTRSDTNEAELLEYSALEVVAQDRSEATLGARIKFDVGTNGKSWPLETTKVAQAWAIEAPPIDAFLRLATTTDDGTNGDYDAGDGDGLGDSVPVATINVTELEAIRDSLHVEPDGSPRNGLFIGIKRIDSVLEFFVSEMLALGLYFSIDSDGKLSLERLLNVTATVDADLSGKIIRDSIPDQERGFDEAENNARWSYDYNPGSNKFHGNIVEEHTVSQDRFGKSDNRDVNSRGLRGRGGRAFGFPDLGWDSYLRKRAAVYLLEFGNPRPSITVTGFVSTQDINVGSLVTLTHPGIYDYDSNSLGVTDALFYVIATARNPLEGTVTITLRQRRQTGRYWVIAPNSVTATYLTATDAEKQYGFICPDSGTFPDGTPAYDVGI